MFLAAFYNWPTSQGENSTMAFLCNFSSSSCSADGEPSLQEHPSEREGDADLLYLHGEEQQEPLGSERRRRQTSGLNLLTAQQQ